MRDDWQLLDWTARRLVKGKRGKTPEMIAPIFKRLGLEDDIRCQLMGEFGRLFNNVAGRPQMKLYANHSRMGNSNNDDVNLDH